MRHTVSVHSAKLAHMVFKVVGGKSGPRCEMHGEQGLLLALHDYVAPLGVCTVPFDRPGRRRKGQQ